MEAELRDRHVERDAPRRRPGASSTRTKLFSSSTGRVTLACGWRTYSCTTSSPARSPVFETVTSTVIVSAQRHRRRAARRASVEREARVAQPVAERIQRRRGAVDVVALPVRAAAGDLVPVVDGDLPGRARIRDRQLPAGIRLADERLGDRGGALLAGKPREQHRRAPLVQDRACRTAGRRRARARPASLSRRPRRSAPPARREGRATTWSRLSPLVQSLGEARLVAHHQHGDVRVAGERDRASEAVARVAVDVAAALEAHALAEARARARRAPSAPRASRR